MTKSALVLSPFATWPADVGHRRRALQTTAMLKALGYRVTFLLYAFEGPWYHRFQEEDFARMAAQWDEVMVHYADRSVGMPPKTGRLHHLDEWWSESLESFLGNLFSRRGFDVFVVHNVWLSRALTLAPAGTVKVLETHDLFHRRRAILDRYGIGHDFYEIGEAAELFGIDRADIAIAIQDEDARDLLGATRARVVSLPFFDEALADQAPALMRNDYLHPGRVTFGFLGSAHTYNVHGMQAVLDALETRVAATFAPVDIALAGSVSDAVRTRLSVRRMGHVPSEADFYARCDIALAATFDGTGFKIKVGDCIALGMPSVVARHSAIGTGLAGDVVVTTPWDMADLMVRIALQRPSLSTLRAPVLTAREDLRGRVARGTALLQQAIRDARPMLAVDLSRFGPEHGALPIMSWLSAAPYLVRDAAPVLVLREDVLRLVGSALPPGVQATTREGLADLRDGLGRALVIDACGAGVRGLPLRAGDRWDADTRWNWLLGEADAAESGIAGALPVLHPDALWDPAVDAIGTAARRLRDRAALDAKMIIVGAWSGSTPKPRPLQLKDRVARVEVRDARALEGMMLELLDRTRDDRTIVWCAEHSAVTEILARLTATHGSLVGLVCGAVLGTPLRRRRGTFEEEVRRLGRTLGAAPEDAVPAA